MFLKKTLAYLLFFVLPLLFITYNVISGNLGAEINTEVLHYLGRFSIFLLTFMLLVKYISKIPFLGFLSSYKKEIGISAFLFAFLHFLLYAIGINLVDIIFEFVKRRYILLGFLLFCLMFLMFIFSFIKKSLFFKTASLILPFSLLGALHYLFSSKIPSLWAVGVFAIIFILLCLSIFQKKENK